MVSGANVTGVDFTATGNTLIIGEKQVSAGTPSPIDVVAGDLLEMSGVVCTSDYSKPWDLPALINGSWLGGGDPYSNSPFVSTYALNLAVNPLGYNIKEIRMFTDQGGDRAGQSYDIFYSLIDAPDTFIFLGSVLTPHADSGAVMTRTYDSRAGATPDAGPAILSGVAKIQFHVRPVGDYGVVWREFDVTGTPTPVGTEVSTTTLATNTNTTPSIYGASLSFGVTVSGESDTPTGNVTLKDNCHGGTTFGSGTLADGACTITTTTLGAGPHNDIVAVYSGNLTYAVSTSSALVPDQVVNPGSSTVTVTGPTSFIYTGAPQGPSTAYKTGSSGLVTYEYVGVDPTTYDSSATPPTAIGTYSCTATLAADDNYTGAVSEPFAFAIVAGNPPSNDNFADAIALTGDSGTQTGTNNIDATLEAGEPTCLYPSTTNTVWFKWTCTTSGNFTLRTLGSTTPSAGEWDSVVGIYTGPSLTELTALPSTPQDNGGSETVTVAVTAGTTYYIQLAGWSGVWDGITYPPDVAANILLTWSFVGGGGGYGSWADTNHVTGGPNGDSDNDGISNLVEYALLLDPAAADGSPGSFDGSLLSFTKRDVAVTNDDVTYAIEISTTLAADSWTEVLSYVENNSDTISCTLPTDVGGKVFARLVVTQQP
jgi:hypothetical protein